ncbi:MAG: CehA/McbA family metallohydrolase [Polyangiaceae bacterium]
MARTSSWFAVLAAAFFPLLTGCDDSTSETTGSSSSGGTICNGLAATFETGDPNGSADVFGAKAAKQARAGRIKAADVKQPAHGRQQIRDGDFVLANDKIAVVVEDKGESDGYNRFGGEILALDLVGDDGRMKGLSNFVESLPGFSIYVIDPTDVSVMHDGTDGGDAVLRVSGKLTAIPFLSESFGGIFPSQYDGLQAAYEYVLSPGAEKVVVRLGVINNTDVDLDLGLNMMGSDEYFGFFQGSHNQQVTAEHGFDKPSGVADFAGFDGGEVGFAYQGIKPQMIEYGGLDISGFQLFVGQGFIAKSCEQTLVDRHQIVVGGPHYDGLREAVRRANGEEAWHAITGKVTDAKGAPVAGAFVHELDEAGTKYLSRTTTAADGSFTIHAPAASVKLVPEKRGYPLGTGTAVAPSASTQDLAFGPNGFLHVTAHDSATSELMPARIHVIPTTPLPPTPASFGDEDESDGKLWQEFSATGDVTLPVPPGTYRVVVAHGPEWELLDTMSTVAADETVQVDAQLVHSVDTTGVMCADFHIHSFQSADSNDPIEYKVRSALADGLDLPVSSEHEWVVDFQPYIEKLGRQKWAHGVPSQELTTFRWGHMGVVPLIPKPDQRNNGAVEWLGKSPTDVFAAVHALPEAPMLIINHPDSSSFGGYFTQALFDQQQGKGTGDLWSPNFDAIEVFNDSDLESNRGQSFADWQSMLAHGSKVSAVGSSDCHLLRTCAVGYPRTCLRVGTDDPLAISNDDVRDAAAKGLSVVSGGLFLSVVGPNGALPGTSQPKASSAHFTVSVQAPGWIKMTDGVLETFVNGKSMGTTALLPMGTGPAQKFVNEVDVPLDPNTPSFVVFHAKTAGSDDLSPILPGRHAFGVSNAIFFE